jgi:histidinol dehydrogenase
MDTARPHGFSEHREDREAGRLVYPVFARRSGGLSLGINLFPDAKRCSFDCPYCEVFPFAGGEAFSLAALEEALEDLVRKAGPDDPPVRDLCLSGNGEPSLSPFLGGALEACAKARSSHRAVLGGAKLVLITNSTGFLDPAVASLIKGFCLREGLEVWAKLDSGTEEGFRAMSGTMMPFAPLVEALGAFARELPIVVQTMLCRLGGRLPADPGLDAYAGLLRRLLDGGARIREVHLYTKARPSPLAGTEALSDAELLAFAGRIGGQLRLAGRDLPLRVFGVGGELAIPGGVLGENAAGDGAGQP